jgi:hypothetical protein
MGSEPSNEELRELLDALTKAPTTAAEARDFEVLRRFAREQFIKGMKHASAALLLHGNPAHWRAGDYLDAVIASKREGRE